MSANGVSYEEHDVEASQDDARAMRGDGPFIFARANAGIGIDDIVSHVLGAMSAARTR